MKVILKYLLEFIYLLFYYFFFKYVVPRVQIPNFLITRHRIPAESHYENTEVEELIATLRETENLEEQGDILQYLVDTQGLDFNTGKFYWGRCCVVHHIIGYKTHWLFILEKIL